MTVSNTLNSESPGLTRNRDVDRACDQFEDAWTTRLHPQIETFLNEAADEIRSLLLGALLEVELEFRNREGQSPQLEEYRRRFPEHLEIVEEAFRTLARRTARTPVGLAAGCVLGDYELLAEIGKGGMGVVYRALQLRAHRVVALKVIRRDKLEELPPDRRRVWVDRFTTEAQALAQLEHDHIVTIHDVGEHDGLPFYAMRYVEGPTLAEILRDGRPLPGRRAAAYLEPLARAVEHAHQRGILHRDLKPKNILVELASDRPYVADFGLAKLLLGEPGPTVTGDLIGSPPYLPPEQARMADAVSVAADVYGLGATLYHLLTGRPPFQAPTIAETLLQVMQDEPIPPRRLNPSVERDLETICLKCLEKEPARRYVTAQALADDLGRYLRGEPIQARPPGYVGRLWRWCRRKPRVAALTAGALVSLLLAIAALGLAVFEANERSKTALDRERSQKRAVLLQRLLLAQKEEHYAGWRNSALEVARQCASLGADTALRSETAALLAGLDAKNLHCFTPLNASAVSLDDSGKRLLIGGTDDRDGNPTSGAQLCEGLTTRPVVSQQAGAGPVAFRRSDGTPLQLVARAGPSALLWDVARQQAVCEFRFADRPDQARPTGFARNVHRSAILALSPDGTRAAAVGVGENPLLAVWDVGTTQPRWSIETTAETLAFSRDGVWLATGDATGRVVVLAAVDGRTVATLPPVTAAIRCLAFSVDGELLAAGDSGGTSTVWDWRTLAVRSIGRGAFFDVFSMAFNHDGSLLACGGRSMVRLYDTAGGRPVLSVNGGDLISGLSFSADGKRLASSSLSGFSHGQVNVWELHDGQAIRTFRGLSNQVGKLCFSADGRRMAALSHNWQVAVWELTPTRLMRVFKATPGILADNAALAFSPDGRNLVLAAGTSAQLWNVEDGKQLRSWTLPRGVVDQVTFHPTLHEWLLFRFERPLGAARGTCVIRTLGNAVETKIRYQENYRKVYNAVSADNSDRMVFEGVRERSNGPERVIRCIDWRTGENHWATPSIHRGGDSATLVLDASGKLVTIDPSDADAVINLVTFDTGKEVGSYRIQPAGLSDGARWVITTTSDAENGRTGFALHERTIGEPFLVLGRETSRALLTVRFSRDSTRVAWGNSDGTVSVCDLEQLFARLREVDLGWQESVSD